MQVNGACLNGALLQLGFAVREARRNPQGSPGIPCTVARTHPLKCLKQGKGGMAERWGKPNKSVSLLQHGIPGV